MTGEREAGMERERERVKERESERKQKPDKRHIARSKD